MLEPVLDGYKSWRSNLSDGHRTEWDVDRIVLTEMLGCLVIDVISVLMSTDFAHACLSVVQEPQAGVVSI